MMRILTLFLGLFCFIQLCYPSVFMALLFDLQSFLFVFILSFLIACSHFSFSSLIHAYQGAWKAESLRSNQIQNALNRLSTLRELFMGVGVVGVLVGLIKMLSDMSDPNLIFPAIATATFPLLYGFIFAELFTAPLIMRLRSVQDPNPKKTKGESNQNENSPQALIVRSLFKVLSGFLFLMTLMYTTQSAPYFRLELLGVFIHLPALIGVFGGSFFISLSLFGFSRFWKSFNEAAYDQLSAQDTQRTLHLLKTLHSLLLSSGLCGALAGLSICIFHMNSPKFVGPAMALCYLSLLYGIIGAEWMIRPFRTQIIANQNLHFEDDWIPTGRVALITLLICSFNTGILFCVV